MTRNSMRRLPLLALLLVSLLAVFTGPCRAQKAAPPTTGSPFLGVNAFYQDWYWVDATRGAYFGSLDQKVPLVYDAHHWPTADCAMDFISNGHIDAITPKPTGVKDISGTYHLSFQCANPEVRLDGGNPAFTVASHTYNAATHIWAGDLNVPAGASDFAVRFHDTNGGIRNVRCIRPGYPANTAQVFTDEFHTMMAPFSVWRPVSDQGHGVPQYPQTLEWKDRDLPSLPSVTQVTTSNWPWEWLIQMANGLNCDIWINVPINATDDYVTQLAKLFRDGDTVDSVAYPGLKPNLHVYVEYSNEVWNFSFQQFFYNYRAARAEINAGNQSVLVQGDAIDNSGNGTYHYAERAAQVSALFRKSWGDPSVSGRVRPVLMWTGISDSQLGLVNTYFGPVKDSFYGAGAAPYFGPETRNGMTVDQLFASVDSPTPARGRNPNIAWYHANAFPINRTLATYYGIHYDAYEGGWDTSTDDSGTFTQARYDANYDPRVKNTIQNFLNTFYADGGELLMYTSLYGVDFRYGSFPLTENPKALDVPKYEAVLAVARAPKPAVTVGVAVSATGVTTINGAEYLFYPEGTVLQYAGKDGAGIHTINFGRNAATYRTVLLNVKTGGTYTLTLNASGRTGDLAQFVLDNQPLAIVPVPTAPIPATNDAVWQATPPVAVSLTPGLHALRLVAVNTNNQWWYQNLLITPGGTLAPAKKPGAPSGLTAYAENGQALLVWQAPDSAGSSITGYTVYRGTTAAGTDAKPVASGITKLSLLDTGLTNGKTYFYSVAATNALGLGALALPASATPAPRPAAPTGLQANVSGGKATLTWTAPPGPVLYYNIYRSTTPRENDKPRPEDVSPYDFVTIHASGPTRLNNPNISASADDKTGIVTLTDNQAEASDYYTVSAVNGAGEGPQTSEKGN